MTKHQRRVQEFMFMAGQAIPLRPTMPDAETRKLRAALILEEALETIEALGFDLLQISSKEIELRECCEPDLERIADGCADLSVVTIGTLAACGIQDGPLLREVDKSNLSKFEDGYRRDDGKWMKGPKWKAPDIISVLKQQGYGMGYMTK